MIRNSREANVFVKFHRDVLSETNSNLQNGLKWDIMTFLIVAFCYHYFENGIKQESCMYDQYVLAVSMSDLCYLLELLLFHNIPILSFLFCWAWQVVAEHGWLLMELPTFTKSIEKR